MITGTQADLIRHLKSEYGRECTRAAISNLVKAKDFRIQFTPGGKIIVDKSAKALVDSGFPKMQANKKKKGTANYPEKPESSKPLNGEKPAEIDFSKPLSLEDPRELIEKHKAFQQAEKIRIENDQRQMKLIDTNDAIDAIYGIFKDFAEMTQATVDKIIIPVRSEKSDHKATVLAKSAFHDILTQLADPKEPEDQIKKKIYGLLKRQYERR